MTTQHRQLGIKTRLFLAFGAVAGTTVVASLTAWYLFAQIGALLDGVATRNIPEVVATLELSTKTQALVASAPNLLNADTQERRAQQLKSVKDMQGAVAQQLDALTVFEAGQQSTESLRKLNGAMNEKLTSLDKVVEERIELAAKRVAASKATAAAHAKVLELLNPALEKVQGDITMASMTIGGDAAQSTMTLLKLVSREVPLVEGFSDLAGNLNLAAGVLDRATLAPDVETVEALKKEFAEILDRAGEKLDVVENLQTTAGLRDAVEKLLAYGNGATSLFEIHRKEIEASLLGRKLLADTRTVAGDLAAEVARKAQPVRQKTKEATDRSNSAIGFGTLVMLAIAVSSIVGAVLFVWLYIGRNIVARIVGLEMVIN